MKIGNENEKEMPFLGRRSAQLLSPLQQFSFMVRVTEIEYMYSINCKAFNSFANDSPFPPPTRTEHSCPFLISYSPFLSLSC